MMSGVFGVCHSHACPAREAASFAVLSAAKELGRAETLHFVQGGRKRPSRNSEDELPQRIASTGEGCALETAKTWDSWRGSHARE